MRWFTYCLVLAGALGAQAPLHVIAVERRGLPPYEEADRVYCLDGGADRGLRAGDRLLVKRAGEATAIGHFQVLAVRGSQCEARFESNEAVFPMKGDLAIREELKAVPAISQQDVEVLATPEAPKAMPEAPPREGILFFLPNRDGLSPAGVKKLESWAAEWGVGGHWAVLVPSAKRVKPALQKKRVESLVATLRALGVEQVKVESEPRTRDGKYDPVWIRHWD